jgi:integrase
VVFALATGCRKGEILSLKWEHVDLKHGFILLDKTKNGERREVPINNTLRAVLQGLIRRVDIPYVFYDKANGQPYGDVKKSWYTACKRAKIVDFRFHDLRHTFASQMIMAGVDITTVSRLLGHKSLKMTLRYSHLSPAHNIDAVKKMDAFFAPETKVLEGNLEQI